MDGLAGDDHDGLFETIKEDSSHMSHSSQSPWMSPQMSPQMSTATQSALLSRSGLPTNRGRTGLSTLRPRPRSRPRLTA